MEVGILGPLAVRAGALDLTITASKERAVMTALALRPGGTVSAERLIGLVWGDDPPPSAKPTLRGLVSRLRSVVGAHVVQPDRGGSGYRLNLPAPAVDAERFTASLEAGRQARDRGDDELADRLLARGLGEWRGDPLVDLAQSTMATGERVRLEELRLEAMELSSDVSLALGRHAPLVAELEAQVLRHPLRERMWGQLMIALYRADRQADALRAYQRARAVLVDELGVEPSSTLRDLEAAILAQDRAVGVAPVENLTDGPPAAGRPVPTPGAPPALRPLRSPDELSDDLPDNLPTPLTRFVGRALETMDLDAIVRSHRLTTLVGAGGMGKTRLALQVAAAAADVFPDGAWFVDLAPLSTVDGVDHTALAALRLEPRPGLTPRDVVTGALQHRRALLVVDNCEHVLDGARDLVADVVRRCPGVALLATSRAPLHIEGERVWEVGPLDIEADAVELFADRARAARQTFVLTERLRPIVAGLCRRLDGMPLAIELAAARTPSMSPSELAQRLDQRFRLLGTQHVDAPVRHRTLEAVVDWSYELLAPAEQRFLARVAVFAGGFDLDAAHEVCSSGGDEAATLDVLHTLVERSLVVAEVGEVSTRYRLLDTIRHYAAARHEPPETRRVGRRHATYYAALVRRSAGRTADGDDRLAGEVDNLRAAVAYAVAGTEVPLALAIVGRLWAPAFRQMTFVEAEAWAATALALTGAEDHPDAVWAHVLIAVVRHLLADATACEHHAHRAIDVESRLGMSPHPRPRLTLSLGAGWQGELETALSAAAEAEALAEHQGLRFDHLEALAYSIQWSANAGLPADDDRIERCSNLAEQLGNPVAQIIAGYVAGLAWLQDEPARAVASFRRVDQLGARSSYQNLLVGLARAHIVLVEHHQQPERALTGLLDALRYFRGAGVSFGLRRLIRDFVPALASLDRHDLVAVIDGAAAPLTVRPRLAQEAVEEARNVLGPVAYRAAFERGCAMTDDALETYLQIEVDRLGGHVAADTG